MNVISAEQALAIANLIRENDLDCDPERWVEIEVGGLGSGKIERKLVGTAVAVTLGGDWDTLTVALHRLHSDSTRAYLRRDGTRGAFVKRSK